MNNRVTDLEKFALEQIWRPYQNHKSLGFEKRLDDMPMSLEDTTKKLILDDTGWANLVLDRVSAIGFTFPSYIVHPLVDLIRSERQKRKAKP